MIFAFNFDCPTCGGTLLLNYVKVLQTEVEVFAWCGGCKAHIQRFFKLINHINRMKKADKNGRKSF